MSLVPMGGNKVSPNPTLVDNYPDVYLSTGLVAENHARESSISREDQDAFALRSHQRALDAIAAGRFADEITPLTFRVAQPELVGAGFPGLSGAEASRPNGRPEIREVTFSQDEGPRREGSRSARRSGPAPPPASHTR